MQEGATRSIAQKKNIGKTMKNLKEGVREASFLFKSAGQNASPMREKTSRSRGQRQSTGAPEKRSMTIAGQSLAQTWEGFARLKRAVEYVKGANRYRLWTTAVSKLRDIHDRSRRSKERKSARGSTISLQNEKRTEGREYRRWSKPSGRSSLSAKLVLVENGAVF